MKAIRYITDRNHIFSKDNPVVSHGGRDAEMQLVKIYPDFEYQTILGFGAAITEAAGYVFSCMDDQQKIAFAETCFGPGGNSYSLARISI